MILRINFERIVILRIFSRRFLHEQRKSYFISDYCRFEKSCFAILFKEQRRDDSYSNSFSVSFYRNFLAAAITDKSIRW